MLQADSSRNKTSSHRHNTTAKITSGVNRSNIMAVDESAQSMVDFELSESKFTTGQFEFSHRDPSPTPGDQQRALFKQGSGLSKDTMPSAIKPANSDAPATLNKSGTGSRKGSNAGADDISMGESDFAVSESNFSHTKLSKQLGSFAS